MTRPSDGSRNGGDLVSTPSGPSVRQGSPAGPPRGGPGTGAPYWPPGSRGGPPPRRRLSTNQGIRLGLIALVITVLGGAGGLAVTLLQPTEYAARVMIEYDVSVESASDFLRTDRNLTSQQVLLTNRAVLGPVAAANGIDPDDLAEAVTATLVTANSVNSEIIQVDVANTDASLASRLATQIASQYLAVVKKDSPAQYIQGQLDEARRQLAAATPATQVSLQTRVATLQGQLDTENISGNRASIVVPTYVLSSPVSPRPTLAAAAGIMLGLVVATLVVIGLSRRWTRS